MGLWQYNSFYNLENNCLHMFSDMVEMCEFSQKSGKYQHISLKNLPTYSVVRPCNLIQLPVLFFFLALILIMRINFPILHYYLYYLKTVLSEF